MLIQSNLHTIKILPLGSRAFAHLLYLKNTKKKFKAFDKCIIKEIDKISPFYLLTRYIQFLTYFRIFILHGIIYYYPPGAILRV